MKPDQPRRPYFHHWNAEEQERWQDLFDEYAALLLGARIAPPPDDEPVSWQELTEAQIGIMEADMEIAARLADRAVMEKQYRFDLQGGPRVRVRTTRGRRAAKERPRRV